MFSLRVFIRLLAILWETVKLLFLFLSFFISLFHCYHCMANKDFHYRENSRIYRQRYVDHAAIILSQTGSKSTSLGQQTVKRHLVIAPPGETAKPGQGRRALHCPLCE